MRVLLVEDELRLSEALVQILKRNNYEVDCVHDGKAGLHLALSGLYDVILLDVMLPKLTGLEILKKLRKSDKETPVILLTARNQISDRITGLDYGADDYIPKPFNTDELLARIRAVYRRKANGETNGEANESIHFGDVTLYPSLLKLTANTREVSLSEKECQMLTYFIRNETMILPVEKIAESVWEEFNESTEENVHRYVSFLQKKLDFINSSCNILEIRGTGYKLL